MTPEQQKAIAIAKARQRMAAQEQSAAPQQLDDYYSSGIFAGRYNPLGAVARSLDAATTAGGDAITFGWGDEAAGLMGMDRDAIRQRQNAIRESNPIASTVGSIGGGLALAGPMRGGLSGLASNSGLGMRVLAGAAEGMGLGGLYGAGAADDSSRLIGAAKGGAIGGAAGAAFPLIAAGAGKVYETARNAMQARPIAQQAGTTPEAARVLGGILQADDSLGPTGRSNMALAGREAMLVDAGPTAQGVLDTTIQRGGPGARIASEAIDDRVARDSARLVGVLDDTLGAPQGVTASRTAIRQGSASARGSTYDDAYRAAIDYADPRGQAIESIVKTRVPRSAINEANALMRADGLQSKQILAKVADDGSVVFERLPDVQQLDYITRSLNEVADKANAAGKLGGTTAKGRAYSNLSREIRDNLKTLVPEYGNALETAADPIRRSQAVKLGSRLGSMPRDEFAEAAKGMTGPERSHVLQGFRSKLDDSMATVTRAMSDGNMDAREAIKGLRELSSRQARTNIETVMNDPAASKRLFDEIDRITTSFELRAAVTGNSRTFGRTAINERVRDLAGADGPVRTAMRGEPFDATKRIVQALTGETPARQAAREENVYAELARLLTKQGGAGADVYNAISQIGQTDAATALMRDRIVQLLTGPQTSYPVATQSQGRL